jgi:hypothetical protein
VQGKQGAGLLPAPEKKQLVKALILPRSPWFETVLKKRLLTMRFPV